MQSEVASVAAPLALIVARARRRPGRWLLTALGIRSGVGKTPLLVPLAALGVPDRGELLIDGEPLTRRGPEQLAALRRRRIGYLRRSPRPLRS